MSLNIGITLKDFQPINSWEKFGHEKIYLEQEVVEENYIYLIDKTTGRQYWNEPKSLVSFKGFLLTLGTPIVHPIASVFSIISKVFHIAISIFKVIFIYPFKKNFINNLKQSLIFIAKDIFKIIETPVILAFLELSALYTIVNPYDGRKLYASFERLHYGSHVLAPCFQPSPTHHLFSGSNLPGSI